MARAILKIMDNNELQKPNLEEITYPSPVKRIWNIFVRLFLPLISSTLGRIYWASKFTWLCSGVRVDNPCKVKLGRSVFLDKGVIMEARIGHIYLGNRVYIGCYSVIIGNGGVVIGSNVLMGAHCIITSSNHNVERRDRIIWEQGMSRKKVTIGDDVWLGANVKVMPGVSIGNGAVVGSGSVVTKDIPNYGIAIGVPAKIVRYRGL